MNPAPTTHIQIFVAVKIIVTSKSTHIFQFGFTDSKTKQSRDIVNKSPFLPNISKGLTKSHVNAIEKMTSMRNKTRNTILKYLETLCQDMSNITLVFYSNIECVAFIKFIIYFPAFKRKVCHVTVYEKYVEKMGGEFIPLDKLVNQEKPVNQTATFVAPLRKIFEKNNMVEEHLTLEKLASVSLENNIVVEDDFYLLLSNLQIKTERSSWLTVSNDEK